jgi:hypothetical protein
LRRVYTLLIVAHLALAICFAKTTTALSGLFIDIPASFVLLCFCLVPAIFIIDMFLLFAFAIKARSAQIFTAVLVGYFLVMSIPYGVAGYVSTVLGDYYYIVSGATNPIEKHDCINRAGKVCILSKVISGDNYPCISAFVYHPSTISIKSVLSLAIGEKSKDDFDLLAQGDIINLTREYAISKYCVE